MAKRSLFFPTEVCWSGAALIGFSTTEVMPVRVIIDLYRVVCGAECSLMVLVSSYL